MAGVLFVAAATAVEAATNSATSLSLGGPKGLTGIYEPSGRIRFEARPAKEWEFMATGTGVSGLTVYFPDEMLLQINHSAAIDEASKVRALGRLHIELEGSPFAAATHFSMETDFRKSVIRAKAQTASGPVRVEIRAHVPLDVFLIEIFDERTTPGALTVRLEGDAPSRLTVDDKSNVCLWHENLAEAVLPARLENPGSGADIPGENRAWLAGRVFGLAIASGNPAAKLVGHTLTLPAGAKHSLLLSGVSTLGGRDAFEATARERLGEAARKGSDRFIASHEVWWREFWARASFEPEDKDGSLLRHRAAFDLYRYYLACCASDRRETPPRFQLELYRYHLRQHGWLTGMICAVEQYQSFYGAMRTGDWAPLRGLARFYASKLPYYRDYARRVYGHGGARIQMWQGPVILTPSAAPALDTPPAGVPNRPYNGENPAGALFMLALFSDYVALSGDAAFADQTLLPLAADLVEFMRLQYPQGENGRMVIAPCNAGETWQGVRDPSEMVCALRMVLPRLIAVGRTRGWKGDLVAQWEKMLVTVPDIPLGRFDYKGDHVKPVILPGDLLVPAADMSTCQAYKSGDKLAYQLNAQQTELYAVWPAKLVLREKVSLESATRSYQERLWPRMRNGWNLDVAFAACLGLREDVAREFAGCFDQTFVMSCGLARETAAVNPAKDAAGKPESPSLQGMGTGVIPVLEMLLQDYPDLLIILPCWDPKVAVRFALYSPYAGKVTVDYDPEQGANVKTERPIRVTLGKDIQPAKQK